MVKTSREDDDGSVQDLKKRKIESDHEYIDQINVKKLDFDQNKVCSVTLSPINVYCCLQCGKFFQGRGIQSPAFQHSIDESSHKLLINLNTTSIYILPDNKEILKDSTDPLVRKIRFAINPQYTREDIVQLSQRVSNHYVCGFIGINNNNSDFVNSRIATGKSIEIDHINSALLMFSHIFPVRDHLLLLDHKDTKINELSRKISLIVKKIWSPNLISKYHISTIEVITYLMIHEPHLFKNHNPKLMLTWLLNYLTKKDKDIGSVLKKNLQGTIEMRSKHINFWHLTVSLPPITVFKDGNNVNKFPQVKLETLINNKFLSNNAEYKLEKLPNYLIISIDRSENDSTLKFPIKDRNQTMVEFSLQLTLSGDKYRLICNLINKVKKSSRIDKDDENRWLTQLYNEKMDKWYEIDGVNVLSKDSELLFLNETYIQIWEKII
ncbi:hypothetical protein KAFR_0B01800 [Kazachstania africana CBS 2517]|uniref:UBP-type domain-containing protein n=1 Tax=Kazachstania africana (strain ATCC 22294 / BCRC 22015 / CBS 2517 / CECT 1963 / NBRC 1671 / NRRL Y-8276) TaxID=1071382 RepID=H2AQ29_KAZAF|nr:hypothetical protein KAFR_0B01800 [Kazachstania africana CBS 2517]CCF56479.1 hypothetical protein KAFR_0B01800 [Kazachstania africana CBS 2517]